MRQVLNETQKSLDIVVRPWTSPFAYAGHFVRSRVQSFIVDYMAETVDCLGIELTLLLFEVELVFSNFLKHEREMILMLLYGVTIDEQIV